MKPNSVECTVLPMVIRRYDSGECYSHLNIEMKGWTTKDNATIFATPSAAHSYYERVMHARYTGVCFVEPAE